MNLPLNHRRLLFDEFFDVKEKQINVDFKFRGNNTQRVLHIIENEDIVSVKNEELQLLELIIRKATLLEPDDCAILTITNKENFTSTQILEFFKPAKLFIWGSPDFLSSQFKNKAYEVSKHLHSYVLRCENLEVYMNDAQKKKMLWEQIKKLNRLIG